MPYDHHQTLGKITLLGGKNDDGSEVDGKLAHLPRTTMKRVLSDCKLTFVQSLAASSFI